jgi:hypothetical protein
MTPEQKKKFNKLIKYVTQLAEQHNALEERVEKVEASR